MSNTLQTSQTARQSPRSNVQEAGALHRRARDEAVNELS